VTVRRAKPLPLPAIAAWSEFDPPAQILVTFCPKCGNVSNAVRTHQRHFVTDRRCEFCPSGRAPVVHVVRYERMAPPVRRAKRRHLRPRVRK
jgi:hypothetical protein